VPHPANCIGNQGSLTIENASQIDLQGRELWRHRLSVHHNKVPAAYTTPVFGNPCIWNLGILISYTLESWTRREHTHHNVNSTIALKCKFKESDLIVPVDNVAADRRSLSSVRVRGNENFSIGIRLLGSPDHVPALFGDSRDHSLCTTCIHVPNDHLGTVGKEGE